MPRPCFGPARILLPEPSIPLSTWACIAVDQFTSQPDYWHAVETLTAGVPSTLHIVLPEIFLGGDDEPSRLADIHDAMVNYRRNVLTRTVNGFVYVERTLQNGSVRQGLVGAVDLEAYSYVDGAQTAIRPSESTVPARIPPRMAVRRGAVLETPHVLMLAKDPDDLLIGTVARAKASLPKLYEGSLMLGGGNIAGWAVEDEAILHDLARQIERLSDPVANAARGLPTDQSETPMVLAVGDGNHSLAAAKTWWEELKPNLSAHERETHPARYCLVEVCNLHSPAIEIEPIHRVLFGASMRAVEESFVAWLAQQGSSIDKGAGQTLMLSDGQNAEQKLCIANPPKPLCVGTVEDFLQAYLPHHPEVTVDYIHGAATARDLAAGTGNATALLLPTVDKDALFRSMMHDGALPRKTFSIGRAEEKRYYMECRAIVP